METRRTQLECNGSRACPCPAKDQHLLVDLGDKPEITSNNVAPKDAPKKSILVKNQGRILDDKDKRAHRQEGRSWQSSRISKAIQSSAAAKE
jgi:hypothetical protein